MDYSYTYDGNGNVSELIGANGYLRAHYEYDPFGQESVSTGGDAQSNEYRFSTKPWDRSAKLYYYGYRFYQPQDGQWVNRDPIEEKGGINLLNCTKNNAIDRIDILGFSSVEYAELRALFATLCNDQCRCSGCSSSECNKMAENLINAYMSLVNESSDCSPDDEDRHGGNLCWQWRDIVYRKIREFAGSGFSVDMAGDATFDPRVGISHNHSYVKIGSGGCSGYLDPWKEGRPRGTPDKNPNCKISYIKWENIPPEARPKPTNIKVEDYAVCWECTFEIAPDEIKTSRSCSYDLNSL